MAARQLGGYALAAVSGRGRGSVVYRARRGQGPQVALKVARCAQLRQARGEPDFAREHGIAQAAVHPHVLRVHGHGVAGAEAYLALELAEGGHLGQVPLPAPDDQVLVWMLQAASALARLHGLGWVHRDLKPANLLLRTDGSLALADFGSACAVGEAPLAGQPICWAGTPRYAAPEQAQGAAAHPSADVYALGAVLFQLLTGEPPFPGATPTELLGQHLLAPVPRLPAPRMPWQPLIDTLLAKEPDRRPPDGQALFDRLQRDARWLVPHAGPGSLAGARNAP